MKQTTTQNPFKVGDILHYQYMYQASFPLFYKVVKVMPKSVAVVELGRIMHENRDGYGQEGTYIPDETVTYGKEKICALRDYYGQTGALVDSYYKRIATKWDGKPKEFYGD